MRWIRLVLFSTALLVSLLGMTAFTQVRIASAHAHVTQAHATPAHATQRSHPQVTCSGNGCNGLNPETTGCAAGSYTVPGGRVDFSNSFVELLFSPTCKTNWGRVTSKVGATLLVIRVQRKTDGLTYTFSGGNFTSAWSAMVYAPDNVPARACGGVRSISGCTAYR